MFANSIIDVSYQETTGNRPYRWPKNGSGHYEANVFAPFGGNSDVRHDTARQGYSAAAPGALETSQHKKGGVTVLTGEADVCCDIDDEGCYIGYTPAGAVGQIADN